MNKSKSHVISCGKRLSTVLAVSAIVFSTCAWADISSVEAESAIKKYCNSILSAQSMKDIRQHWSVRFKKQNDDIETQQRSAFTPEVRSLLEIRTLDAMKESAKAFPSKRTVKCAENRCVVNAHIYKKQTQMSSNRLQSDDVVQTITLIKENGVLLIDDASTTINSKGTQLPRT